MALTRITSDGITDGTVVNADLHSAANIAKTKLASLDIVNADVNASAAIAGSKISPDFGSQNVVTTGDITANGGDITASGTTATLHLVDTNDNPNWRVQNNNGTFRIYDATSDVSRLNVNTDGHVDVTGNLDVGAGIDVTGNIVASGNLELGGLPNTTTNSYLKIAIQDTDGALKSDDTIKINPAQDAMSVNGLFLNSNTVRASGNGPLNLTTANASGTVDLSVSTTQVTCNGNLLPATDSTDNLGADATRWANVYADTLYGDGSNLTGVSSPEIYGFNTNASGHLIVTTTNSGVDNISGTDYDAFEDVIYAATGFTFSLNANGNLIATI